MHMHTLDSAMSSNVHSVKSHRRAAMTRLLASPDPRDPAGKESISARPGPGEKTTGGGRAPTYGSWPQGWLLARPLA